MALAMAAAAHAQTARPMIDYSDVVAKLKPAVVRVTAHKEPASFGSSFPPGFLERFGERRDEDGELVRGGEVALRQEQGTAFVFDAAKGQLLTTAYMVEDARRIDIVLPNGEVREAKIVGRDDVSGVALIQTSPGGLANVVWSDKPIQAGQPVVMLGNAHNLGIAASAGMVANAEINLPSQTEKMFLLDMAVMKGTAGAPVVDVSGAVIGMAAAQYGSASGNAYENLGVAYDGAEVRRIATILARDGRVKRGKIGVTLGGESYGPVSLAEVVKGSPAERAGLKPGDEIVSVAGVKTRDASEVTRLVGAAPIGSMLAISVRRGKDTLNLSVAVVETLP